MKFAHNAMLVYQWTALVGGAASAAYFFITLDVSNGMLSLMISFLSLIALKLEVWSLR